MSDRNDPDFKAWQAADIASSRVERALLQRIADLEKRVTALELGVSA